MKQLKMTIELGRAQMAGVKIEMKSERTDCVGGQIVGVSRKAIPVGMTIPIGYVRRWNEAFVGGDSHKHYSSIVVDMKSKEQVAGFVTWIKDEGYEQEDSYAEELSSAIFIVTLLFLVISFVIIGISAVNISHTFFMLISERRREIGILRAIGATRGDVRKIILGEAALIGLAGGLTGIGIGMGAAFTLDWLSREFVRDFPFKPDSYFAFTPALILGALAFAVAFCVLGAFLPARKAARMQPAQALTA
jgi:ABC-type antimicrobial peptide transport system permease subunit